MDRKYLLTAFGYVLLGLALGMHMAASKNHGQMVTHAHIMMLGFVMSFVYAVCHKLWLSEGSKLSTIQYICHQVGTLGVLVAFFMMYGNFASGSVYGPLMGISSLVVFGGAVIMKIQIIKATKSAKA